jgi:cytochrome c553
VHPIQRRRATPRLVIAAVLATAAADGGAARAAAPAADLEFFETKVRPLLVAHCAECHSRAGGTTEGGLSFDSRGDFAGAAGVAVAGRPDESLLVKAVRYDGDLQMPPDGKLPAAAIATLEEWVRRGLPWPDDGGPAPLAAFDIARRRAEHWCWQPARAAPAPEVRRADWCRGPIDRFVLARLEAAGLEPAPEAARVALVRRAAAVLTGLPPDPALVAAAGADPRADWFEHVVDALLASPHYGERFARHWLDVVRYAETRGHEFDYPIPNAWRYRDWVVRAFNADLPYDRFLREQIAGDLVEPRLDPATGADESVVGTGFWFLGEEVHSPVDIAQDEADRIDNRIDTLGKAFLGMALGCARCHDHKFDALSAADYYALAGTAMSGSYRQVPFESLAHNRRVAAEADALTRSARATLLPLVAEVLASGAGDLSALLPTVADAVAARRATAAVVAPAVVIADYTRGPDATAVIADGAAWGDAAIAAGQPVVEPAADTAPARVRLSTTGAAKSDPVWSASKSLGEREPSVLGKVDRAGRVLRTPKVRLTEGVLWHHVRGHLQIATIVDGHVMLAGPLYGATVKDVDTKGAWQWVRQDLTHDIAWHDGHVVHVEYAAIDGAAEVAEVVASRQEPVRADPLVTALAAHAGPLEAACRALLDEAVAACRDGRLDGTPHATALAGLVDRLLASPTIDWTAGAARRLAEAAGTAAAARAALLATARPESATAPALLDGNGIDQHVLLKGSAARRGDLVPRRFLEAIDGAAGTPFPAHTSGRLELADRLLAPDNPLTARVAVNRIWHWLFGRGLVPTPDNFGVLGEPPADPAARALLDTLAVHFREEGWSVKQLVREVVTSATWRMSSSPDPRARAADPLNLLLHHHPLRRLEAEAIRDTILAVSGRLDRTLGGPPVEVFLTEFHDGRGRPASGPLDGAGRRSVYTRIRRNFLPGFLTAFDMPVPFQAMGRRTVTNVPAQALVLMNDPFVAEQATIWARKVLADASLAPEARITTMYREAFAREPTADEVAAARAFLVDQTAAHGGSFAADERHEAAWADLAHALFNAKEFIFVP